MYENIIAVPFRNRNVHLEYFIVFVKYYKDNKIYNHLMFSYGTTSDAFVFLYGFLL